MEIVRRWGLTGLISVVTMSFLLAGCKKPQLRSESGEKESEEPMLRIPAELRKAVIGKTFASLTLGDRVFTEARIRDITDDVIVVAHASGVDEVPWSAVDTEVKRAWGFDPSAVAKSKVEPAPKKAEDPEPATPIEILPESLPGESKSAQTEKEKAIAIAGKRKMLEAQLAGIRSIESSLARHSSNAAQLRSQLNSLRARQRNTTGRIMVERVEGKSTIVDRKREAEEVQVKLKAEEHMVAQFSKSLQAARKKAQDIQSEIERLRSF